MPPLKTYDLFVSHAWKYDDDYYRLTGLLHKANYFRWRNYSVPQHDPLDANNARRLCESLKRQIAPTNAVLIISGMYVKHRDWIQYEIKVAQSYSKPIIGIEPWGSRRVPTEVQTAAATMVGWRTDSIVKAIRTYAI